MNLPTEQVRGFFRRNSVNIAFAVIAILTFFILYLLAYSIHKQQVTSTERSKALTQLEKQSVAQGTEMLRVEKLVEELVAQNTLSQQQGKAILQCLGQFFSQPASERTDAFIQDLQTCTIKTQSGKVTSTAQPSPQPSTAAPASQSDPQPAQLAVEPESRQTASTQQTQPSGGMAPAGFLQQALSPVTGLVNKLL